MSNHILPNLSNEEYHSLHGAYKDYISSSQLKRLLISPRYFKYSLNNPPADTEATKFGALFHELMQFIGTAGDLDTGLEIFKTKVAVFLPPINEKTGQPYGAATKTYKEAYDAFIADSVGYTIATVDEMILCERMARSLLNECDETSSTARALISNCAETECSYFYENDKGVKLKARPDMLTDKYLIDWKSTSLEELTEENITRTIIKYGYHISMAMYQHILSEVKGKWYSPLLVFIQKQAPYDSVIVDLSGWCYTYDAEFDISTPGIGAMEYLRLVDLYAECRESGKWPGVVKSINPNEAGERIMKPEIPLWYGTKIFS